MYYPNSIHCRSCVAKDKNLTRADLGMVSTHCYMNLYKTVLCATSATSSSPDDDTALMKPIVCSTLRRCFDIMVACTYDTAELAKIRQYV